MLHAPKRVLPVIAFGAIVVWSGGMNSKHLVAMKLFSAVAVLAITSTMLMTASRASARPHLFIDSFSHGRTYKVCIADAKKVLEANGFENFDTNEDSKYRSSSVRGYHKSESLTAEIECNQKLGITLFGVSGLDSEITYKMYQKLFDAEW